MGCAWVSFVQFDREPFTSVGLMGNGGLEEDLLNVAGQIRPAGEYCAAEQFLQAGHRCFHPVLGPRAKSRIVAASSAEKSPH
jgi:hypothetical protein